MDVSLYEFDLPKELIAQEPTSIRTESRLMVLHKETGELQHTSFTKLIDYLSPGDVLVLNQSRVRRARLIGEKRKTGAKVEILLLKPIGKGDWEALVKPAKRIQVGTHIDIKPGQLTAIAKERLDIPGGWLFQLQSPNTADIELLIEQCGQIPLPPYIQTSLEDDNRYQTVFAKELGSVAAPTAGLHFTTQMLEKFQQKGVQLAYVTLHVGLGTFRPVTVERVEDHQMHAEFYEIQEASAKLIQQVRRQGGRVMAVGTTAVRTLESVAHRFNGEIKACQGWTDIFIYPGYSFQVVDALLTNFHLPRSTLLMLVSAFGNRDHVLSAYQEAVKEEYRFFSFGDAMLITPNLLVSCPSH